MKIFNKRINVTAFFVTIFVIFSNIGYASNVIDDSVILVDIQKIFPSQLRYSEKNVEEKYQKAIRGRAVSDNNHSLFESPDAIPVISFKGKFFLVDGHHSILASKQGGFKLMPVKIIEDYSGSETDFWSWMEENNYAYLRHADGTKGKAPDSFGDLVDDPLRYFVAVSARKFEKSLEFTQSVGADYPLWVKVYKGTPFMEFKMAEILYALGFKYAYTDNLSEKIEEARRLIVKNRSRYPALSEFPFLYKQCFYKDSDELNDYLAKTAE